MKKNKKEDLKSLAHQLELTLGNLELLAIDIENMDLELGEISMDVEEVPKNNVEMLALQMVNMRHSVMLLSSLLSYVRKDLGVEMKKLSDVSTKIFDIAVKGVEENDN